MSDRDVRERNPKVSRAEDGMRKCEADERMPDNHVANVNGHDIFRAADGVHCHVFTVGVGWWAFDLSEESARHLAARVGSRREARAEKRRNYSLGGLGRHD